jgi:hypothetical protein
MADLARRLDREARLINARGQNAFGDQRSYRGSHFLQLNGEDVLAAHARHV